jgi:hypothetical protein
MSDLSRIAANLERFRRGVAGHDRENPTHKPAYGIGVSFFDLERLGFEDGEELWAGVTIHVDGKATGNFRVLCGLNHGEEPAREAEVEREVTRVVGAEA